MDTAKDMAKDMVKDMVIMVMEGVGVMAEGLDVEATRRQVLTF